MGNEEWVGVWPVDPSTTRSWPCRAPSASPCAQLQLDRSPSFSHIQKEVARCVWTGGGGEETAAQMVVVFLEHSTVYSPSGLVISFTWLIYEGEDMSLWLLMVYIIFNLMLWVTDASEKHISAFKSWSTLFSFYLVGSRLVFSFCMQQLITGSMLPTHYPNWVTFDRNDRGKAIFLTNWHQIDLFLYLCFKINRSRPSFHFWGLQIFPRMHCVRELNTPHRSLVFCTSWGSGDFIPLSCLRM